MSKGSGIPVILSERHACSCLKSTPLRARTTPMMWSFNQPEVDKLAGTFTVTEGGEDLVAALWHVDIECQCHWCYCCGGHACLGLCTWHWHQGRRICACLSSCSKRGHLHKLGGNRHQREKRGETGLGWQSLGGRNVSACSSPEAAAVMI